jgi:hypothetical protein
VRDIEASSAQFLHRRSVRIAARARLAAQIAAQIDHARCWYQLQVQLGVVLLEAAK